jgi:hypothetical protein
MSFLFDFSSPGTGVNRTRCREVVRERPRSMLSSSSARVRRVEEEFSCEVVWRMGSFRIDLFNLSEVRLNKVHGGETTSDQVRLGRVDNGLLTGLAKPSSFQHDPGGEGGGGGTILRRTCGVEVYVDNQDSGQYTDHSWCGKRKRRVPTQEGAFLQSLCVLFQSAGGSYRFHEQRTYLLRQGFTPAGCFATHNGWDGLMASQVMGIRV